MIRYANGIIKYNTRPDNTLVIHLSETGHDLFGNLNTIIELYKKHVSCICISGKTNEASELARLFEILHKEKFITCLECADLAEINPSVFNHLDYAKVQKQLYQKEYSPFGDEYVWVETCTIW